MTWHTRDDVEEIVDHLKGGASVKEAATKFGISDKVIHEWLRNFDYHTPYLDWVAIERSIDGDRKVFERLTRFEKLEFWNQLAARNESPAFWKTTLDRLGVPLKTATKQFNRMQKRG